MKLGSVGQQIKNISYRYKQETEKRQYDVLTYSYITTTHSRYLVNDIILCLAYDREDRVLKLIGMSSWFRDISRHLWYFG